MIRVNWYYVTTQLLSQKVVLFFAVFCGWRICTNQTLLTDISSCFDLNFSQQRGSWKIYNGNDTICYLSLVTVGVSVYSLSNILSSGTSFLCMPVVVGILKTTIIISSSDFFPQHEVMIFIFPPFPFLVSLLNPEPPAKCCKWWFTHIPQTTSVHLECINEQKPTHTTRTDIPIYS